MRCNTMPCIVIQQSGARSLYHFPEIRLILNSSLHSAFHCIPTLFICITCFVSIHVFMKALKRNITTFRSTTLCRSYTTPLYSALPSRILLKVCPIFFFVLLLPLCFFLFYSFSLSSPIAVSLSSLRYLGLHLNKKYASGPFFFMLPLPLGVAYFWHYCDARFKKTSLVIEFTPCLSSHGHDVLTDEDRRGFDEVADTSNRPSGLSSRGLLSSNIISSYLVLFHLIYLISSYRKFT